MLLVFHRQLRGILFFLAFLSLIFLARTSAQAAWGSATSTRHRISLCGDWEVQVKGKKNWSKTRVPGEVPSGKIYFFRKTFVLGPQENGRVFRLFVEKINFRAAIKLNRQYVGDVPAGFESRVFLIDPGVLHAGENVISIEVNTKQHANFSLPPNGGFLEPKLAAGMVGRIFLLSLPSHFLAEIAPKTEWSVSGGTLSLRLRASTVDSSTMTYVPFSAGQASVQLFSAAGTLLASRNFPVEKAETAAHFQIPGVKAWTPRQPVLYRLRVTLQIGGHILDDWQTTLGFRQLATKSGHFFLNGTRFQFKGLSLLPAEKGVSAKELGEAVKRLGGNALHFIFPPSPAFYDVADSLGIFVFTGLPLWNPANTIWKNKSFVEIAGKFESNFVTLFGTHPSLASFIWANGLTAPQATFASRVQSLSEQSGFQEFPTGATFRTAHFEKEVWPLKWLGLDLTTFKSPNWKRAVLQAREAHPELPVLLTQISVPLVRPFNRPEDKLVFEQRQGFYLAKILRSALRSPLVDGCFVLADRDFPGAYPSLLSVHSGNRSCFPFGLVESEAGAPRVAWKVVRDLFHGKNSAVAEVAKSRDPRDISFILWGFAVIIFFLYFLKGNRRVSGNFARIFSRPHGFYQELESERRIAWGHSLIINFSASATLAILAAGVGFFYRESFLFDFFATKLLFFHAFKNAAIPLVWNPAVSVPVLTGLFFLIFSALAIFIQVATFVAGRSLSLRNSLTLVYWLSGVFIFLSPLAMIVVRVWSWPVFRWGIILLVFLFSFWFLYRILLGMQVILHFSIAGTTLIVLLFAGVFFGALAWIYQSHLYFFPYLSYLIHVLRWGI